MTLLKRLPPVDPRGPQEQNALVRAYIAKRWRWRNDPLPRPSRFAAHVLRFGGAARSGA